MKQYTPETPTTSPAAEVQTDTELQNALHTLEQPLDVEFKTPIITEPELYSKVDKNGITRYMIRGVNPETGHKYNRFAHKEDVEKAFGPSPVEEAPNYLPKHMAKPRKSTEPFSDYEKRRDTLGENTPQYFKEAVRKIDGEAANDQVNPHNPSETIDDAIRTLTGDEMPQSPIEPESESKLFDYDKMPEWTEGQENMWAAADAAEQTRFAKVRRLGKKALAYLGLATPDNPAPTIQAPNRQVSAEVDQQPEPWNPPYREEPVASVPSTQVHIRAEQVAAPKDEQKAA